METIKKHPLQRLCEDAGIEVRSYSGRAMYGKRCLGVDVDSSMSAGRFFSDILQALVDDVADEDSDVDTRGADLMTEVAHAFRDMQQDSMGTGYIFYFPRIPFVEEEDESDDEEEAAE